MAMRTHGMCGAHLASANETCDQYPSHRGAHYNADAGLHWYDADDGATPSPWTYQLIMVLPDA